jgi:molybdenum cofactor biosynthesis enzyme MoaA
MTLENYLADYINEELDRDNEITEETIRDGIDAFNSIYETNVRLTNAAPEMLEALEEVVEVLRQYGGLPADAFKYDRLIKKAKGE